MNLILLQQDDFTSAAHAVLKGRRLQHILEVHRAGIGDTLKVGVLNGQIGEGRVLKLSGESLELEVRLEREPPAALPITLVLALPRPKMLKRTLQTVTALGVKQLYLINSYRVEKSFWGSPLLSEEKLREHLFLGLEQAGDTILPDIHLRKLFKPFVEDELPALCRDTRALVAHPYTDTPCPIGCAEPVTLAVGPEGGFIPYEVEKLQECGFTPVSLGPRILRVETAVPVLLSRLGAS